MQRTQILVSSLFLAVALSNQANATPPADGHAAARALLQAAVDPSGIPVAQRPAIDAHLQGRLLISSPLQATSGSNASSVHAVAVDAHQQARDLLTAPAQRQAVHAASQPVAPAGIPVAQR